MKDGKWITMGIESSCDETSVAILQGGRTVLSNVISSQIKVHQVFGGVVPEIAARHHLENINGVLQQALEEAEVSLEEIDAIGVTYGPGLVGALLIGLATAKAIAFSLRKPLVGVHHIQGHISANFIEHTELEPPFLALVVSGGHTHIVDVRGYNEYEVLGRTRDDAAGEAFDKVARVLGLGYPGGPKIDKIAKEGDAKAIEFKRVYLEKGSLDFSFSGLKTSVLNYLNAEKQRGTEIHAADVAASFQQAVVDVIVDKAILAAKTCGKKKIVLAGGVAANSRLRKDLSEGCKREGITLYAPSPILCTDNAAMIACAAYYKYQEGLVNDLTLDACPNLPL
ncbi:tRNA (adenosine(37)-N6)-threonylcarbamoyltransferase complex transferase subunit TsaD [Sinanaerobacter sp. ZZT-01]|uniref:tRNA (adenosine(37)-N6)-threonylcarbamoyltransferase complex transferase subunit TsaD n=1 Tax=Sinanaerobacter sp. ZZT-01 TaxID=3111540 RepID=UPI002D786341|nr:tRNA (adenosine(37)-N6)-threonylcarbamoyltransferase complex transferase subunit TsaD [Sinanaerobacter sp. ZZT-01]WRR95061.1 tRNA (adenosine(37)-N6)-threonylcarbamoyltransferase complex transferase subunit TsaD [Sinanaerobacter sp. ZZT-01]